MNKPAIYPASAAELYRRDAGEKYRPSNGTEGEIFMAVWCYRCTRWSAESGCEIANATMFFDVDESDYPAEWRIGEDGQPECTAYGLKCEPVLSKDERQSDLFEVTP
jgi:hypothetical protein